jgi:outer membrane receptor protein involved in Fe transport
MQILAAGDGLRGKRLNEVSGNLSVEDGLNRMLAGTGLTHKYVGDRGVVVLAQAEQSSSPRPASGKTATTNNESTMPQRQRPSPGVADIALLQEIVVVGTNIRGIQSPVGAELITLDREEINKTGRATIPDVLQTLPQNFSGGVSEETTLSSIARETATDFSKSSAINLRGLGVNSTLVLVNGRRIAPAGSEGAFVDVSNIPLSAVDRIEILPDGASAMYGSDAVGGVVNLKLRRDYSGVETEARYGSVTRGSCSKTQVGQTLGTHWGNGNALLSLEFFKQTPLAATSRAQMVSDLRPFGGSDFDWAFGNPGTIIVAGKPYAIPHSQNGTGLTRANFKVNTQNLNDRDQLLDIIPEQKRYNALASINQQITDRFKVFADLFYAHREVTFTEANVNAITVPSSNGFYVNPAGLTGPVTVDYDFTREFGPRTPKSTVKVTNVSLGGSLDLPADWQITATLTRSEEKEHRDEATVYGTTALTAALADPSRSSAFDPFGDGVFTNSSTLRNLRAAAFDQARDSDLEMRLAQLQADGRLLELPGGDVKLAAGAEYRKDLLQSRQVSNPTATGTLRENLTRNVRSVYSELFVPFFGANNALPAVTRLELTAAGRYDDYSDFGHSTVPHLGLTWSPVSSISLKGTWSKAFRAPGLVDMDEARNGSLITSLVDPQSPTGRSNVLVWTGQNKDLTPETARIWTGGIQFAPPSIARLSVTATYFNIDYQNRIDQLGSNVLAALTLPQYAVAVIRNPTAAERQALCSRSTFSGNAATCLTSPVAAILDARLRNLAHVQEDGVDLLGIYGFDSRMGEFDFGLNATYLFNYSRAATSLAAPLLLDNTQNNPLDFRARASLGWKLGGFDATLFANYANAYKDVVTDPQHPRHIASWTTFDLNLSYDFESYNRLLSGTQVFLSAENLFDRPPPFFNNPIGIGYDPENASLVGRFVSLHLRTQW